MGFYIAIHTQVLMMGMGFPGYGSGVAHRSVWLCGVQYLMGIEDWLYVLLAIVSTFT